MGGLFGEANTWLPGLATKRFYVIYEIALFKQGFFVLGPFNTTARWIWLPYGFLVVLKAHGVW